MLGHGIERERLERLAEELGCRSRFRFLGQVDRRELSREMSRADFCIQPSLTEGFSKAWLDAMAHGLPVIASSVGAAPQVVAGEGERGWLTPPGDIAALAQQIAEVTTAPVDWPAIRRRCRAFAESRTLESWSARISDLCLDAWDCLCENGKLVIPTRTETDGAYVPTNGSGGSKRPGLFPGR
jgi:glycosyltransferase involved in cell wall biosynthesis